MNVGIDLIEIKRIKKSIENERFIEKVFSAKERELFAKKNSIQTIAGRFCVKEAFSKALGTGVRDFELDEISTLNDELGCPYVELEGGALKIAKEKGIKEIKVSITHTEEYASAIVIVI